MTSAIAVAQAFLDLAADEGAALTNMQLQKLVFFSHGVHLAAFDASLINEPVRAWDFGPVIPDLYDSLRRFGGGNVPLDLAPTLRDTIAPEGSAMQAIRATWDAYKGYSAWQLSDISHLAGSPWDQVWNQQNGRYRDIPNTLIKNYYQARVNVSDAR